MAVCTIMDYGGFNCGLQLQVIEPHAGCAPHSLYPNPTNFSSFTPTEPALVFPAVSAPSHVHLTDVTSRFWKMATAAKDAAKRKSLSLKEKNDIIKIAEDNPALFTTSLGESFGSARTIVTSVLNNKLKYKQLFFQNETDVSKKRVRSAKFEVSHKFLLEFDGGGEWGQGGGGGGGGGGWWLRCHELKSLDR